MLVDLAAMVNMVNGGSGGGRPRVVTVVAYTRRRGRCKAEHWVNLDTKTSKRALH